VCIIYFLFQPMKGLDAIRFGQVGSAGQVGMISGLTATRRHENREK
jgi:hypothetical protein